MVNGDSTKKSKPEIWFFVVCVACLIVAIILMVSVRYSLKHFESQYEKGFKDGYLRCNETIGRDTEEKTAIPIAKKNQTVELPVIMVTVDGS